MSHGGKRIGSGRKLGSTNRFSVKALEDAAKAGDLPLDYLLTVMRNPNEETRVRMDAAKAAAPYLHHRLNSITVDVREPEMTHEDWLMRLK